MRIYLLYLLLLFVLAACNGSSDGDFAKTLLEHQSRITRMEFSGAEHGDAVVSITASEKFAGAWLVNNRRPVNDVRWADWWNMLADLRVRPLYLDAVSLPAITDRLRSSGLRVAAYAHDDTVLDDLYIARFDNIGMVALSGGDTYLIDLPYNEVDVLSYCSADVNFWQDRSVFACLPADMTAIEVLHCSDSSASFRLVRDTAWSVMTIKGRLQQQVNREVLQRYVSYFREVQADSLLLPGHRLLGITADSRHLQHRIRITGPKVDRAVRIFGIPLPSGQGYDTDKCLLYLEDTEETALAPWVNFDLLLKNLPDFVDKKQGGQAIISL